MLRHSLHQDDGHRFRFSDDALIELGEGVVRCYGRWDRVFGCWEINFKDGRHHEIVPDRPVLSETGIWLSPKGGRLQQATEESDSQEYEARTAIAAFFSTIPLLIRRMAAPFGKHQWLLLEVMWAMPESDRHLDELIFKRRRATLFKFLEDTDVTKLNRQDRVSLVSSLILEALAHDRCPLNAATQF